MSFAQIESTPLFPEFLEFLAGYQDARERLSRWMPVQELKAGERRVASLLSLSCSQFYCSFLST